MPRSFPAKTLPVFYRGVFCLLFWALAIVTVPIAKLSAEEKPVAGSTSANASASCLECHSDHTLTMRKQKREVPLFVDQARLAKSVHGSLDCVDCHEGFDGESVPHKKLVTTVDCTSCHEDMAKKHVFHANLAGVAAKAMNDVACTVCHGTHETTKVRSADFSFAAKRQAESCGQCHEAARRQFFDSAHGMALVAGAIDAPVCLTCHQKPITCKDPTVLATVELKRAQAELCQSCHVKKASVSGQAVRGMNFVSSFDQSVHGAALHAGKAESANCVDCHGAHEMNRAIVAGAKINKQNQPGTCAKCHEKVAMEFNSSVHAVALRKGNADSPVCTDCHGEHEIKAHTDSASPVFARNVAQQVCASCHASLRLTQKYGLSSNSFQTFADSYHGLAARGGSVEVVNCASCHDVHAIKSHLDPTSTVHKSNLVQTCGQCHPGANTRFTVGSVHVSPSAANAKDKNSLILRLVADFYVWMIVLVVGGMSVHNFLDLFKKVRRKLKVHRGLIEEEHVAHRLYIRMTLHERLQHAALVISFVLLVVTGFMLRYPEAWWVVAIRNLSSSAFELRGLVHRVAGVVILAAGVWHVSYLAFTKPGRSLLRDLLPAKRDFTDPFKVLKYNLGLAKTKPEFPRFCYIEKAEYWALVWGTILMGITGLVLWFDNTSMGLFTKLGFDISRTIHFYEAILATLAIIVWHFYFVLFNPDIYPMNLAWLTGHISEREMMEDHPLELKQLKEAEAKEAEARKAGGQPPAPEIPRDDSPKPPTERP
ncbi:MAG: cytochrome c3 family protein [Verrucomicrobia bacterium]|nr:cytochrome c3 family protein [Verrucomicrobiota bacterium]